MIIYTVDMLDKYIGQKVKDPYGRVLGTLASLYSEVDGTVKAVEVVFGESVFKTIEIGRISISNGEIVIIPEWKHASSRVIEKLERARKRAKALEELYSKGEIPKHAYDEFKAKLSKDLDALKDEAKTAKELIRKRINEIEDQVVEIEKALTSLKMSYIAGEIGERGYKQAADILRSHRDRNIDEKNDAKKVLDLIGRLESADISTVELPKPATEAAAPATATPQQGSGQNIVVELVGAEEAPA
ncbi:MAG: CdvA-like protein [Fervidicoccaceae archaeon]|nr:CdvA-like protein [Fervidicoccaceae archaeon]MCC6052096.1 CdvA-like protein [Fervidicoccaceae archaeon]